MRRRRRRQAARRRRAGRAAPGARKGHQEQPRTRSRAAGHRPMQRAPRDLGTQTPHACAHACTHTKPNMPALLATPTCVRAQLHQRVRQARHPGDAGPPPPRGRQGHPRAVSARVGSDGCGGDRMAQTGNQRGRGRSYAGRRGGASSLWLPAPVRARAGGKTGPPQPRRRHPGCSRGRHACAPLPSLPRPLACTSHPPLPPSSRWYDAQFPESAVLQAWRTIVLRYKDCWNVFAAGERADPGGMVELLVLRPRLRPNISRRGRGGGRARTRAAAR